MPGHRGFSHPGDKGAAERWSRCRHCILKLPSTPARRLPAPAAGAAVGVPGGTPGCPGTAPVTARSTAGRAGGCGGERRGASPGFAPGPAAELGALRMPGALRRSSRTPGALRRSSLRSVKWVQHDVGFPPRPVACGGRSPPGAFPPAAEVPPRSGGVVAGAGVTPGRASSLRGHRGLRPGPRGNKRAGGGRG